MNTYWLKLLIICSLGLSLFSCNDNDDNNKTETPPVITEAPTLKGKLVYHNYTTYDTEDSKMYIYDFGTNELKCISENWKIRNAMNAHFSPDGKQITFMGIGEDTNTWDIFLYDLSGTAQPVNLTPYDGTRDEDPKFSPDGKRIAFKQDFRVAELNLETGKVTKLSPVDYSMPYYNADGTKLICSKGDGATSSIAVIDIKSKSIKILYDAPKVQDYYPINADETSFYYSVGYSETNRVDQVYRGFWSGLKSKRLPFNNTDGDYSDAYPVNNDWVIICSTRTGSLGGYDLYIANVVSGEIFPMTDYNKNINTAKNELGPCVYIQK